MFAWYAHEKSHEITLSNGFLAFFHWIWRCFDGFWGVPLRHRPPFEGRLFSLGHNGQGKKKTIKMEEDVVEPERTEAPASCRVNPWFNGDLMVMTRET